jgi:hypothetical protein
MGNDLSLNQKYFFVIESVNFIIRLRLFNSGFITETDNIFIYFIKICLQFLTAFL